jgi:hypothetical protein
VLSAYTRLTEHRDAAAPAKTEQTSTLQQARRDVESDPRAPTQKDARYER